jgi:5,5'-dehydrodivanillate O-demethylase oxygenase subunit
MIYRTTKQENEILTRVGPRTPMGELLRRYWWPVGISDHLKDKPTLIRVLGEDLVLFRDVRSHPAVIGAKCAHRRANLCLGNVEKGGLRCRYHGWLYDTAGRVAQTPGEPPNSKLKDTVHHPGYPAEELGGFVFTYMGPRPMPLLPRFHFLAAEGERYSIVQGFGRCNWLQAVENGIDPLHAGFLHGDIWEAVSSEPETTWFEETEWGIAYKVIRSGRKPGEYNYREHHLFMPGISSGGDASVSEGADNPPPDELPAVTARWGVPIDDTHMMHMRVFFKPSSKAGKRLQFKTLSLARTRTSPFRVEPYGEYKNSDTPTLGYTIPKSIGGEDAVMLDSMGPIADRENENLTAADESMEMLRKMYLKGIETVKAGEDPKGVIRDKEKNKLIVIGGLYRWISPEERKQLLEAAA